MSGALMYEWFEGQRPQLVSTSTFPASNLPGRSALASPSQRAVARLGQGVTSTFLTLSTEGPVTIVALELGGLLLVSNLRCDDEEALSAHLDLLPVSGWELLPEQFVAKTGEYLLVDAALPEGDARSLPVTLSPGRYDVETYTGWSPDPSIEVHLVRMIRVASP